MILTKSGRGHLPTAGFSDRAKKLPVSGGFRQEAPGTGSGLIQVLRMNFSRHRGQVMEILPLPRGTRTGWWHWGQS